MSPSICLLLLDGATCLAPLCLECSHSSRARSWRAASGNLLGFYAQAKISAKDLATTCWCCEQANVPGVDWASYSLPPGQSTDGAYQRKLNGVIPSPSNALMVPTPL